MGDIVAFSEPGPRPCMTTDAGLISVPDAERLMETAVRLRLEGSLTDCLFFLAHPPTISVGLKERNPESPKDLLVSRRRLDLERIALVRSIRGGGITYHWPGQLVCFPVIALETHERNIPAYMGKLEETGIRSLKEFGVKVCRRRDSAAHVGLWRGGCKLVSTGIRVSRWVTSFGFAVNLAGDHAPSHYIRPCGIDRARLMTLEEALGEAPSRSAVQAAVTSAFAAVFDRTMEVMPNDVLERIRASASPGPETMTGSG